MIQFVPAKPLDLCKLCIYWEDNTNHCTVSGNDRIYWDSCDMGTLGYFKEEEDDT